MSYFESYSKLLKRVLAEFVPSAAAAGMAWGRVCLAIGTVMA
jgi:hypothetical protein